MSEPNILFQQKDVLRRFLESAAERERKEFDLETLKKTQTEEAERAFGQLRHALEQGKESGSKDAENAFRTLIQIAEDKKNAEREAVLMSSRNLIEETEKILAEVMASHRRTLTLIEKAKIKGNHALPPPTKKDYVNPLKNLKELKANSEVVCRLTRELEKNVNKLASIRAVVIIISSIMVLLVIGLAMFPPIQQQATIFWGQIESLFITVPFIRAFIRAVVGWIIILFIILFICHLCVVLPDFFDTKK